MKRLIFLIAVCVSLLVFLFTRLPPEPTLLNPTSSDKPTLNISPPPKSIILGFLPYWNLNKFSHENLKYLTDLVYFGLTIDETGHLVTQDLGYRRFLANYSLLRELSDAHQLRLHLSIKALGDQELFNFLNNKAAHTTLIQELTSLNSQYPVEGINIDLEPDTATDSATISQFTQFISSLRSKMESSKHLTIDVYPSAASSPKLWDLSKLAPLTDYFVVMAYDYTRANSSQVGPVAPVYPPPGKRHALVPNLRDISKIIPPSQLLIGLPLYGYEWSTDSTDAYAPALVSSGQLATYQRIAQILASEKYIPLKDPHTLSSRLTLNHDDLFSQIYYEDLNTLLEKTKFAQNGGFAGVALWSLGYEGKLDIWSPIKTGLGLND